jgi:hypothetical protein
MITLSWEEIREAKRNMEELFQHALVTATMEPPQDAANFCMPIAGLL